MALALPPRRRYQCRRRQKYWSQPPEGGEETLLRVWISAQRMLDRFTRSVNRADGQGLAEYALILSLIAIIAIVALLFLGGQVSKMLSTVGSSV